MIIKRNIVAYVLTFLISYIVFIYVIPNIGSISNDPYASDTFIENTASSNANSWVSNMKSNETDVSMPTAGAADKWKRILIWTPYFGKFKHWSKVFRRITEKRCSEYKCCILSSKDELLSADAVVFYGNDLLKKGFHWFPQPFKFPQRRKQDQIYVFMSLEPPPNLQNIDVSRYRNFFNWTMSYRQNSDIVVPYGKITRSEDSSPKFVATSAEELQQKKLALWMVSHCSTNSKRETFVKELQKYISVDVYGECGDLKCGKRTTLTNLKPNSTDPCDEIIKGYTFYLALENSLCKDYVTEKFYRTLKLGVIPVTLGGVDYDSYAPPKSYIDVKDFNSVKELAMHLKNVAADVRLYNEYMKWKDYYDVEIGHPYYPFTCDLCEKLHSASASRVHKTYEDIYQWYVDDAHCYPWKPS